MRAGWSVFRQFVIICPVDAARGNRTTLIDVGKAADLVLVKGNPTNNVRDIENVVLVFKDGAGYDPVKLVEAANGTVGMRAERLVV